MVISSRAVDRLEALVQADVRLTEDRGGGVFTSFTSFRNGALQADLLALDQRIQRPVQLRQAVLGVAPQRRPVQVKASVQLENGAEVLLLTLQAVHTAGAGAVLVELVRPEGLVATVRLQRGPLLRELADEGGVHGAGVEAGAAAEGDVVQVSIAVAVST